MFMILGYLGRFTSFWWSDSYRQKLHTVPLTHSRLTLYTCHQKAETIYIAASTNSHAQNEAI